MKVWDLHCDTLSELRKAEHAAGPRASRRTICISTLKNYRKATICCSALQHSSIWVTKHPERTRW